MPRYRATIRFGTPQRYHVLDLTASSLREAIRITAEEYPAEAADSADLVEIRTQPESEERAEPG